MSDEIPAIRVMVRAGVAVGDARRVAVAVGCDPAVRDDRAWRFSVSSAMARASGFWSGFGQPLAQSSDLSMSVVRSSGFASSELCAVWDLLTHWTHDVEQFQHQAGVQYCGGYTLAAHTLTVEYATDMQLPQLCVDLVAVRPDEYALRRAELLTDLSGLLSFDGGAYIPSGLISWGDYALTKMRAAPLSSAGRMAALQPDSHADYVALPWGVGVSLHYTPDLPYKVEPVPDEPGEWPAPDNKEVYIIVNSVNVFALPSMAPLSVADIRLSLDRDSFSWSFACEVLNEQSIELMRPDASGMKDVLIEINGHRWVVMVAAWSRSRKISENRLDKRFSVSGYSRTQYMAQPYAPKRTRSIGNTTAVQAAQNELVGTGFSLDWDVSRLSDWSMPNAAYSYQELTPLQAIKRLASTVGADVQPLADSDGLVVRPRYFPAPWDLHLADMDKTIHCNQVLSEGGSLEVRPKINSVFVSGERDGVALTAVRAGSAGDVSGADVVDAWLTDLPANTSRARHEIASSGDRILHTLELAVPESGAMPGLLLPHETVAVVRDGNALEYRAYVSSVTISAPGRGVAKVRQSVELEQPVGWEFGDE